MVGSTPAFFPRGFIATAVELAMMAPAQRHGELIADQTPSPSRRAAPSARAADHYTATLSLSPSARITLTVANSGFPSVESAL
jgi:hypothetical protein